MRDDVQLIIDQNQIRDRMLLVYPENERDLISLTFHLSGNYRLEDTFLGNTFCTGRYLIESAGLACHAVYDFNVTAFSAISFLFHPKILDSFTLSSKGEFPKHLQHLTDTAEKDMYCRFGDIQPMMVTALHQILHCPYQGMIKRAYIESKFIELFALVLADESAVQQEKVKQSTLKPEQIEQIHYAREILLRDMYNPPSLVELARQVGLNDFLLKKGFRQVFGNTVFGELQAYRLELAKQLLAEGSLSAAKISRLAGYASPNSFSKAFKQKFGVTPTAYRKSRRLT